MLRAKKIEKEDALKRIKDECLLGSFNDFICFNLNKVLNKYNFDINNFCALLESARFLAKERKIKQEVEVNDS